MIKKANDGYKIFYTVLIVLMSFFGGLFSGKLIAASVEYSIGSPYHFEKVVAEIVDTEFGFLLPYRLLYGRRNGHQILCTTTE